MANENERLALWQTRMREFQQLQRPDSDCAATIEAIADMQWKLRVLSLKFQNEISSMPAKSADFSQASERRKVVQLTNRAVALDELMQGLRECIRGKLMNRAELMAVHTVWPLVEEFEELLSTTTGVRWNFITGEFRDVLKGLNSIKPSDALLKIIDQLAKYLIVMRRSG